MKYAQVRARKGQLVAVTGLKQAGLGAFHAVFGPVVDHQRRHSTRAGQPRQRALHALPRASALARTAEWLLFVLSYLQHNPLQATHAAAFNLTHPQVNQWLHRSLPWLREAQARLHELPARPDQLLPAVLAGQGRVLPDATERPVPRSTDADTQRAHYSGKKAPYGEKQPVLPARQAGAFRERAVSGQRA